MGPRLLPLSFSFARLDGAAGGSRPPPWAWLGGRLGAAPAGGGAPGRCSVESGLQRRGGAWRRALALQRADRADRRARYELVASSPMPRVEVRSTQARTADPFGDAAGRAAATAAAIARQRAAVGAREAPAALAYDAEGVLLCVATREGRLSAYNHAELAAAGVCPEGGDPIRPLVEVRARGGGGWRAVRWNPANQNEVCAAQRSAGRLCVYDLAYCNDAPTQVLVTPRADGPANVFGGGGSGSSLRVQSAAMSTFEDMAWLEAGARYHCGAATRDGTVLLWDRRAGARPVAMLSAAGDSSRASPLRALNALRLDGLTGGQLVHAGTAGGFIRTWDVRAAKGGVGGSGGGFVGRGGGAGAASHALLASYPVTTGAQALVDEQLWRRCGERTRRGGDEPPRVPTKAGVCDLPAPPPRAQTRAEELVFVCSDGALGVLNTRTGDVAGSTADLGDHTGVSTPARARRAAVVDAGRTLALPRAFAGDPNAREAPRYELYFLTIDAGGSLADAAVPCMLPSAAVVCAGHPLTDEVAVATDDGRLLVYGPRHDGICEQQRDDEVMKEAMASQGRGD